MFVPLSGKTVITAPWNEERSEKVQAEICGESFECVLHFYKSVYLPKEKYKDYISNFKLMEELAKILKNKRAEQGYLNLDIPESKIELDIEGKAVIKVYPFSDFGLIE